MPSDSPRGRCPLDEALPIARQIAEALEAAHAQGIVHRDLKPANIKIDPSGTVKVLDFGLARGHVARATGALASPCNSPTITRPAMTHAGMILGTAAYMAPEQARGKVVDHRADIWAFGVVLFEMITGTRAFDGEEISDVLASVLKSDPKWTALPAAAPAALRRLIRRCLERDPKRRLQAIGEARIQIDDLISGVPEELAAPARAPVQSNASRVVPWALALVGAGLAIATLLLWAPWRQPPPASPIRMSLELGAGTALARGQPRCRGRAVTGRHHARFCRADHPGFSTPAFRPSTLGDAGHFTRGHGKRRQSVLLTRWSMDRVLCRGETEESARHRWRGGDDYRRAELTRRGMVRRRHDCVCGEPKRLVPSRRPAAARANR